MLSPLYKVQHQQHLHLFCSDQLFSDTSICMIFFGPERANAQTDCFECLQVVMVDFFMADQLCSQVLYYN